MPRIVNNRFFLFLCLLGITGLFAGCAGVSVPVSEKLTLYQGGEIEDLSGTTFDGGTFNLPDGKAVARNDVQSIQFQVEGAEETAKSTVSGTEGLTPLAQSLLERGQAMAKAYPGVSGVILVDDGDFIYNKDGTNSYRYRFAGLVLKEEAKSWGQLAMPFTEGRRRVNIQYARSVNPDGTVHTLDPNEMKVGSPSEAMQFFNPNRKMLSGLIPGVEVGAIVEYGYEIETYNPEDPRLFFPGYFFQGMEPVVFSQVKVQIPDSVPFNYVTRNFTDSQQTEPVVEKVGDDNIYTWLVEDVPPMVPEPMMPAKRDVMPMMDGSVFKSYEDVYKLQNDLQEARIKLTPEIETAVAEITEDAEEVEAKLARLYHWVQTNTRYISIKGSLGSGFSGHTAQETFENRYGDCTDKAMLFAAMCKAIGVKSCPIILMTNDNGVGITEIPSLDGNHCISKVYLEDRSFYLDTTSENYRYPYFRMDDHGAVAFNAAAGEFENIPVPPPEDNQRLSHLHLELKENGDLTVRTKNRYNGNIEAGIRRFWKSTREDNRKFLMANYVNSISPGAILEDFTLSKLDDLSQQVNMTIDYALTKHAIRARDLMYLRIPTLEQDFAEASLEKRRFPVQYMSTEERILEVDLSLPVGFHAKWLPPPLDISSPYLEFHAAYEEDGGIIRFRQSFRRLKRIVPTSDYPEYRDALRAISSFSKKEIFIAKEGEK